MIARRRLVVLGAALTIVLVGVLVLVLVHAARTAPPVLLDEADFAGAEDVSQGTKQAPNWSFCAPLAGIRGERVAGTYVSFGRSGTVVAALIDGSVVGVSADENLELVEYEAEVCAERAEESPLGTISIEPQIGLDDDSMGWRAESLDGTQGEYIAIKLDDWRVLAVGFEAHDSPDLVDMDELVRLAREGAAQFELDRG